MSVAEVNNSTNRLLGVLEKEKTNSVPQVDLVRNSRDETRRQLAETYKTGPETIALLEHVFVQHLDEGVETKGWYEVWKQGNDQQFWNGVYSDIMKNEQFAYVTSKLGMEDKGRVIKALSWISISNRFLEENGDESAYVFDQESLPRKETL